MGDASFTLRALWALRDDRELTAAEWRVAVVLVSFCDEQGRCWPSVRRIAEAARAHRSSVQRAMKRLEAGVGPFIVTVDRSRQTSAGDADSNGYLIALKGGWPQRDPTPPQPDPTPPQPAPGVAASGPHGWPQPDPTGGRNGSHEEDNGRRQLKRTGKREGAWRRVPAHWAPNDAHRKLATDRGVDFGLELSKFRDHEFKTPKTDPDAAFRNWLRGAHPMRGGPVPVQRGARPDAPWKTQALARGKALAGGAE